MTTLVLFDIDGTLIQSGRAGVRAMNLAFAELFGHAETLAGVPIAGRTDRAIVGDVLERLGLEAAPERLAQVRDAYCDRLHIEIGQPSPYPSGVLPGVLDLLIALEARDGVAVGLLTGNFERGASIKLGHFDLWHRFAFGAFGDHHADRRALVPIAVARAQAAGHAPVAANHVVVIGDTPLDVDCAHAHGALAIAVATGSFDRQALLDAGADLVVETLVDAAVLKRILSAA